MTCEFAFGARWLSILSLPGITIAFLFVLFCVLRTWLGNWQFGGPQYIGRQKCRLHSMCSWGPTGDSALRRTVPSHSLFWLSLGLTLDLGRVVSYISFSGTTLASKCCLMLSGIFTVCPSWKPDKIFVRCFFCLFLFFFFFLVAVWSEVV